MKKRLTTVLIILMVVAGLSLMLYPTVSNYLMTLAYRRTIYHYTAGVEQLDNAAYDSLLTAAREYNCLLAERGFSPIMSEQEREEYNSLMNMDGAGVMGYVSIPSLDIALPIYHGTSDSVLQNGVGHLEGSSLPVGGGSTHSVISGHTGLPSARLFTNIDQLVEGDVFTIQVLREVLTYEVDQILVVLPYETGALAIERGKDYCTLLTCTPYGINSHRLLVRGHRIPTPEEPTSNGGKAAGGSPVGILPLLTVLLVIILLMGTAAALVWRTKRYRPKHLAQKKSGRDAGQSETYTDEEVIE